MSGSASELVHTKRSSWRFPPISLVSFRIRRFAFPEVISSFFPSSPLGFPLFPTHFIAAWFWGGLVCLICFYLYWCPLRSFFPPMLVVVVVSGVGRWGGLCRDSVSDGIAQHVALMANSVSAGCAYRAARNARYCHTSGLYLIFSRQVFVGSRGNSNNLLYRKKKGGDYIAYYLPYSFFFLIPLLLIACLYLSYFFVGYAWIIFRQFLCLVNMARGFSFS